MRHAMKVIFAVALVFSFIGVANAAGIPTVVDTYNYPEVWTQEVYNGSGDEIQSATVVRWDCGESDGAWDDMGMWVETVGVAADNRTAGVVPYGQVIADKSHGTIIIRGPAVVYNAGNTCTAATGTDGIVESDNAGHPVNYTISGSDSEEAVLGWSIIDGDVSTAYPALTSDQYSIIFVDPTLIIIDI